MKRKSPFETTFPVGLANGYYGYIPDEKAFTVGGYETWRAKSNCLARDPAARLVRSVLHQLARLAA